MDTQEKPEIDPLRRVFVPVEVTTPRGTIVFRTLDKEVYVRLPNGSIRHARLKINGKQAKRARQRARR